MAKPFKFRYVNEIVGVFVLLIVAALVVGVVLVGRAQGWFEQRYTLRVGFPAEGSAGVQKGAEVIILGTKVGRVDQILVRDDGSMEGVLVIRGPFSRFIRSDSTAVIKRQFGVAGDAFIEITKGSGPPVDGDTLAQPAVKDTELVQMMQQMLEQIQSAVLPLLEQIRKAAEEYTGLAADLRNPDGHLQQLLARFEELAAGLEKGEGTAGKLLKDPATVDNVNRTVATVNETVAAMQDVLEQVEAILKDVKMTSSGLPVMMLQTQDAVQEAQTLIEGIQKHWLLRKYVEPSALSERIAPSAAFIPEGP